MNAEVKTELIEAQKQLLDLINPIDSPDICKSLRSVFNMALLSPGGLTEKQKDDLFILNLIIETTEKVK